MKANIRVALLNIIFCRQVCESDAGPTVQQGTFSLTHETLFPCPG